MLNELINSLCEELSLPIPKLNEKKIFPLRVNEDIEIDLQDLNPGIAMRSKILACPEKRREDLFIWLMRANLLGQGTSGARIGIDVDEKTLTLSLGFPYEMKYHAFRDSLQDFINYLVYWREEIAKFETEETIL